MTRFYLIRHGETEWNASGRWQGHTDVPLNATGRWQARLVAKRLRSEGTLFTALYSSDLERAWATAEAIGGLLGLAPQPMVALREIDIGWWGGLTRADILARDAELIERLDAGEDLPRGGAESLTDLYKRASAAIDLLAEQTEGDVIIATHGGTIRALIEHGRTNGQAVWPWPYVSIGNTSISIIERTAAGWQLEIANDLAHLTDVVQTSDMLAATPGDTQQV